MICERRGGRTPGLLAGTLIVAVGVVLLLDRLGIIESRSVFHYWPILLIIPGLCALAERDHGRQVWGAILVIAGGILLGNNLGLFRFGFRDLWPLFLIAVGLLLVWRTLQGPRLEPGQGTNEFMNEMTIFGGGKRKIATDTFRGGSLMAVFGGHEIDLRGAEMDGDHAVIRATCIFGGVEIHIPTHWDVVLRGTPVFGGMEDKTVHPKADGGKPVKHLIVDAVSIFGGVEVGN